MQHKVDTVAGTRRSATRRIGWRSGSRPSPRSRRAQQLRVAGEQVVLEVAQDRADAGDRGDAGELLREYGGQLELPGRARPRVRSRLDWVSIRM